MTYKFHVGQKVVSLCSEWISNSLWKRFLEYVRWQKPHDPIEGGVYTISGFEDHGGEIYLCLEEFSAGECYNSDQFRPLDTAALQLFRKIARDVTERAKHKV